MIAEAGVNHNGSVKTAKRMVDVAARAGADAVKFQTFKAERVASAAAPKARYQKSRSGAKESQLDMLKRLELDVKTHRELIGHCKARGIEFLSSPFDLESVELLKDLKLKRLKIPSGELTNLPYLKKVGSLRKEIILSTGMANLSDIDSAVNILVESGTSKEKITVLHCNTAYPTPYEDANLKAMLTIKDVLNVKIGYSDHTSGIEAAVAAVALGASIIEKHFTLNKNAKGPDHKASVEPGELKRMISAIRNVERALGDGVKRVSGSEMRNRSIVRKSIIAAKPIRRGELFVSGNVTTKRPATGISAMEWNDVLGRAAKRDFKKDEFIEL
ncbi:MAG: N-acetylneuraminate synthase [Candidatus Omnitrophota bacterium]